MGMLITLLLESLGKEEGRKRKEEEGRGKEDKGGGHVARWGKD
jgi:hypothetical protein